MNNSITLDHCILENDHNSLQDWIRIMQLPEDLASKILEAKIVLVPQNFNKIQGVFMPTATELTARFKARLGAAFDICATDDSYNEISLCSHKLRIGHLFVSSVVLPIAIGVAANYIYDYMKGEIAENKIEMSTEQIQQFMEPTTVEIRMSIYEPSGKTKEFTYDGPADKFEDAAKAINLDWNDTNSESDSTKIERR